MFTKGLRRTALELSMNVRGLSSSISKETGVSRSWESDENIVSKRLIGTSFHFNKILKLTFRALILCQSL